MGYQGSCFLIYFSLLCGSLGQITIKILSHKCWPADRFNLWVQLHIYAPCFFLQLHVFKLCETYIFLWKNQKKSALMVHFLPWRSYLSHYLMSQPINHSVCSQIFKRERSGGMFTVRSHLQIITANNVCLIRS